MLGLNQNVRNVPVSSRKTNAYSAISPSRNVQWSGKILRMLRLMKLAAPRRSSSQFEGLETAFGMVLSSFIRYLRSHRPPCQALWACRSPFSWTPRYIDATEVRNVTCPPALSTLRTHDKGARYAAGALLEVASSRNLPAWRR